MEKGDLFFKDVKHRYDSWMSVIKWEVYHVSDKSKLLATVIDVGPNIKNKDLRVLIDNENWKCASMGTVLTCIVEYYTYRDKLK